MLEVKITKNMGRGVFATKNIKKNTVVNISETLVVKKTDIRSKSILFDYFYELDDDNFLLAIGFGSLLNHSKNPNIEFKTIKKNKRFLLEYRSIRNIKKGEQILFDYGMPNEYN